MVNKKRLVELLGDGYYISQLNGGIRHYDMPDVTIWLDDELDEINSIPQLLGRCVCSDDVDVELYDEIYSKVDDSIFEVDIEKVKNNLNKLGLVANVADRERDVILRGWLIISKDSLKYVEKMERIPKVIYDGENLYNNVLKASKEWK